MNAADFATLWLKAHHLKPDGVQVTIERVDAETVHPRPGEEKRVLVLSFRNARRRLILNGGNVNRMADIGGEDPGGWPGLVVRLKPVKYTAAQNTVVIEPATANGK